MKLARLADPRFHEALNKLAAANLPVKTAFKLKGVVKKVREEYSKYEEVRLAALNKYGKKKEDGSVEMNDKQEVQFAESADMIKFATELQELSSVEIDLPTISLSDLGENVTLNMDDVDMLEGLIVE